MHDAVLLAIDQTAKSLRGAVGASPEGSRWRRKPRRRGPSRPCSGTGRAAFCHPDCAVGSRVPADLANLERAGYATACENGP